ncbi:MAG: cation-efflux pump [Chloroflexota bacterium]|nr:cation-efflux pump [Chloroflexota bacterium]
MPEQFSFSERRVDRTAAAERDKSLVALSSVVAAVGLTGAKLIVGLLTGSLGILAEAAHSALDLVAALLTFFAVRLAGRPPDPEHRYGHGRAENLSAFVEAALLLLTAVWVIYEAVRRLFFAPVHVEASIWAFLVMAISIVVDIGRARALGRAAEEYDSQALAADALHFRTDIWSSAVVILGLLALKVEEWTGWSAGGWLGRADALAALGVSAIVLSVTGRLLRDTIDALLDRAPDESAELLNRAVEGVPGVLDCRRLRLRRAGDKVFADVVIAVARTASFGEAHAITEAVEAAVQAALPGPGGVDAVVHMEPVPAPDETPGEEIGLLARQLGMRAHDVRVRAVDDRLDADLHVEVDPALTLDAAHELTARLERAVRVTNPHYGRINTHLEAPGTTVERQTDITTRRAEIVARARDIADGVAGPGSCHEVRIYALPADDGTFEMVLHCWFPGDMPINRVHAQSAEIERRLHNALPGLREVLLHAEPAETNAGRGARNAEYIAEQG